MDIEYEDKHCIKAKYCFLYKTINLLDGKFYIGVHKTEDLDDGYMGSGKYLLCAIKAHGINNFKREILQFFDDPRNAYQEEGKIVDIDFVNRKDTYNVKVGGRGGWDHIDSKGENNPNYGKHMSEEHKRKLREISKGKKLTEEHKQKLLNAIKGKAKTEEHKQRISVSNKGKIFTQEHRNNISIATKYRPPKECALCIEIDGKVISLREISKRFNINYDTLRGRYNRGYRGEALLVKRLVPLIYVELNNKKYTLKELSEYTGIAISNLEYRYNVLGLRGEALVSNDRIKNSMGSKPKLFVTIRGVEYSLKYLAKITGVKYGTLYRKYRYEGLRDESLLSIEYLKFLPECTQGVVP